MGVTAPLPRAHDAAGKGAFLLFQKHARSPISLKADGDGAGTISAVFSTFNTIDSDGDVVMPSAFTEGQSVPLVWSHDWAQPVGRGVVKVQPDRAVFEGQFFTDTVAGREAYLTVKAMSDLQEFSWGFRVLESEPGTFEERAVRFIKRAEVFEVSPVLVGANRSTYTLDIKADKCMGMGGPADGSFEALSADLSEAFTARQVPEGQYGFAMVLATYSDHFVAALYRADENEPTYWDVPYTRGADGPAIGDPKQVEAQTTFVPVKGFGIPYDLHEAQVRADVRGFLTRTKAGAAIRMKEGRAISTARRTRMEGVATSLRDSAGEIDAMLAETAPPEKAAGPAGADAQRIAVLRLRSEFDRATARRARDLGVPA